MMVVARGGDEKWIVIGIRIVESHSRYQVRQVRAVIVTSSGFDFQKP